MLELHHEVAGAIDALWPCLMSVRDRLRVVDGFDDPRGCPKLCAFYWPSVLRERTATAAIYRIKAAVERTREHPLCEHLPNGPLLLTGGCCSAPFNSSYRVYVAFLIHLYSALLDFLIETVELSIKSMLFEMMS